MAQDRRSKNELAELKKEVHELKLTLNEVHDHNFNISPLPSADELSKMEAIEPGITNRIMSMAENQLERTHQHNMALVDLEEKNQTIMETESSDISKARTRAQWMSFTIMLVGFATAGFFVTKGNTGGAIVSILGAITPTAIAFLASHKK